MCARKPASWHRIDRSSCSIRAQWLTPKEREELRRQVREAEEAEAERKRRNYITLDLVGRQASHRSFPQAQRAALYCISRSEDSARVACA